MRKALMSDLGVGVLRLDANGDPVKRFWVGRDGKVKSSYTARDARFDPFIKDAIENGWDEALRGWDKRNGER